MSNLQIIWTECASGEFSSMAEFRKVHSSAEILLVDGVVFHGECSKCSGLIVGDDRYSEFDSGLKVCEECSE